MRGEALHGIVCFLSRNQSMSVWNQKNKSLLVIPETALPPYPSKLRHFIFRLQIRLKNRLTAHGILFHKKCLSKNPIGQGEI
jgi:hypothetical protein